MANYYIAFSFNIKLPKEATDYLIAVERAISEWWNTDNEPDDPSLASDLITALTEVYPGGADNALDITVEREGDEVAIYSEDGGNIEGTVALLQHVMRKFDIPGIIAFGWANYCDKPRTDAFGGGAVAISKTETRWLDTQKWIEEQETTE